MNRTYLSGKSFLWKHDLWPYFGVLVFFSYVFMQTSGQLGWGSFYGILAALGSLFSPLLLFVALRKRVLATPRQRTYWWIAFVFLPVIVLWFWPEDLPTSFAAIPGVPDPPMAAAAVGGLVTWVALLIVEGLSARRSRQRNSRTLSWLLARPLWQWAVLVVALFSLGIVPMSNYFQTYTNDLPLARTLLIYAGVAVQTFIIYLSFYPIYFVHHHMLFNGVLRERGLLHYLLGAVAFLILFVPFQNLFISAWPAVAQFKIHPLGLDPQVFSDLNFALPIAFFLLSFPFIVAVEWYRQANALTRLQQEKAETELQLLKQQINPHFFFNTLNNLYAMSLTQEKETPETILQLSELMRYVIYKGREKTVPIRQEIKYLKDYLDLQSIRLHQENDLQFQVQVEDEECPVPPMLFIILVENAFKHGIESSGEPGFLHLALEQQGNSLHFACRNSQNPNRTVVDKGGLGLDNLRRRLAAAFPRRHELSLRKTTDEYHAEITLQL